MTQRTRTKGPLTASLALVCFSGCAGDIAESQPERSPSRHTAHSTHELMTAESRGRELWLKATFGGERFFSLLLPLPPFELALGFDAILRSPRGTRFDEFGVINDPDCVQGDASSGYLDKCVDDDQIASELGASAGIIGVRKLLNPTYTPDNGQPPVLIGIACASCHAGLDAQNPPDDPNQPSWDNIDLLIGNQFLEVGKIFREHLLPEDPRYQCSEPGPRGLSTPLCSRAITSIIRG